MKSGQVVKGMINGDAVQYETPDISLVLPIDKLGLLIDRETIGFQRRIFKSERVIGQSVVTEAEPDEHGRKYIVNHTVIYKFEYNAERDGAPYKFDPDAFVEQALEGKFKFKMPPMPELKHPLDLPPAWEVVKE